MIMKVTYCHGCIMCTCFTTEELKSIGKYLILKYSSLEEKSNHSLFLCEGNHGKNFSSIFPFSLFPHTINKFFFKTNYIQLHHVLVFNTIFQLLDVLHNHDFNGLTLFHIMNML